MIRRIEPSSVVGLPTREACIARWVAFACQRRRVPQHNRHDTGTSLTDLGRLRRTSFSGNNLLALLEGAADAMAAAPPLPVGVIDEPPAEPEALWHWAVTHRVSALLLLPAHLAGGHGFYSTAFEALCRPMLRDSGVVRFLMEEAGIPFPAVTRERPQIAAELAPLAERLTSPLELPASHPAGCVEVRMMGSKVVVAAIDTVPRLMMEVTPDGFALFDLPMERHHLNGIRIAEYVAGVRDLLAWPSPIERAMLLQGLTPRWRQLVDAINALDVDETVKTPSRPTRVAVHLDLDDRNFEVKLQQERKAKKGQAPAWTIGKTVSRLGDLKGVDEESRNLVARILDRWEINELTRTVLLALVGYPHVFIDDAPVQVVARALRLKARAVDNGGLAIDVLVGDHAISASDAAADDETAPAVVHVGDELVVAQVPLQLRPVLRALDHVAGVVPSSGREAILQAIARAGARLDVDVDATLLGESRPADARPIVRIEPGGELVQIALVVRPLAGAGGLIPGQGALNVVGVDGGRRVSCVRDSALERSLAGALAFEHLEGVVFDDAFRAVVGVQEALGIVLALHERPDVVIEWPARRLSVVAAVPSSMRVEVKGSPTGLHVRGAVTVDGTTLDLVRVIEASRDGQRFIALDEHRFVALTDALRVQAAALGDAAVVADAGLRGGAPVAMALESLAALGVDVDGQEVWAGWRDRLAAAAAVDDEPPRGLDAVLRPYQREGLRFLRRLAALGTGGVLADDMGLGKTLQAIALLVDRARLGPQLIVAPTSVGFNWRRELERFAPGLRLHTLDVDDRGAVLAGLGPSDVLVTSYGLCVREAEAIALTRFSTLILDEAQAVKNADAQRARAVRGIVADVRFALTGTPLENHTGDLWSLFAAVSPGILPSSQDFRARFQLPIDRDKSPQRRRALATLIRPFLLRRTKAEVAPELPSRTEITLAVALTDVERSRYDALRKVLAERFHDLELPPAQRRVAILSALMRLRQVACHVGLDEVGKDLRDAPSSKLLELRRLIVDLKENRHRVLVFSQFTRLLDLVEPVLEDVNASFVRLDGATSTTARAKAVDRFQAGEADVFLLSLKAGGFGLNLTAADYVIHLDPWWNPAAEAQATDRAHRIGQTRPVTVYRLVAEGTIEDAVVQMQAEKRALFAAVLDDEAAAGGAFSEQDLLALLGEARVAREGA